MKVSILTPSGGRPRQLALCKRWVARMAEHAGAHVEHVVSEDVNLIVPRNLLTCLRAADPAAEIRMVVEDDDWYPANWLEHVLHGFESREARVFGSDLTVYYHVPTGGFSRQRHPGRSSLNATAWRSRFDPVVAQILQGVSTHFVDVALWKSFGLLGGRAWAKTGPVGLKGLPGRAGAGAGHTRQNWVHRDDAKRTKLRAWLGDEDAETYLEMLEPAT